MISQVRNKRQYLKSMSMDKETIVLKKRLLDLANQSYQNNMFTFSGFLSLHEQQLIEEIRKENAFIAVTLYGGNTDCERMMARFGNKEELGYEEAFPICCIKIEPLIEKFADALTHRDFLGAVMNLGIERNTIGDIFVQGKSAYLYCHQKMAEYLLEELDKVKHTHVKCHLIDSVEELPTVEPIPKEVLVSSCRIDGVISKVYNISRTGSLELFRSGRIFVNGKLMENNSYVLKPNDSITVRGFGKFIFKEEVYKTKKEKLRILIEKYE